MKAARILGVVVAGLLPPTLALPPTSAAQATTATSLVGAWRTVMFVGDSTRPLRSTPVHPVPDLGREGAVTGLRLFTREHYSTVLLILNGPRQPLPDSAPTAEQLLKTWAPFAASTGRYELSGDTLIATPSISKNPRFSPQPSRYLVRLSGDSLFIMVPNGITEVAVRVERSVP